MNFLYITTDRILKKHGFMVKIVLFSLLRGRGQNIPIIIGTVCKYMLTCIVKIYIFFLNSTLSCNIMAHCTSITLSVESQKSANNTGWSNKNGTVNFLGLCSNQQLSVFTLLDRASFLHYNNTTIIKYGWELFILWVLSYGLSFLGFARFPEFRSTINDKLMANPENDSP